MRKWVYVWKSAIVIWFSNHVINQFASKERYDIVEMIQFKI